MKIKLSKSTKTIIQLVIMLIIIGFVIVLLYKNFNKPENKNYILTPVAETASQESKVKFNDIIQVVKGDAFKSLVKFGNWPVKVEEKGRANPFIGL